MRRSPPEKLDPPVASRMRAAYHADPHSPSRPSCPRSPASSTTRTRRRGEPARRPQRDADRAQPGCPTHARPHAALDQRHRVHDLDLSRPRPQRQELARRADGAALVRRRDDRGRQAVPSRQRTPAPGARCATRWRRSPKLSAPTAHLTTSQPPDDHRATTEVPRDSGARPPCRRHRPPAHTPPAVPARHRSPRTDRSTCASPTPSPSAPAGCALAWGLPNQTNLLHVLQGNSPGCRPTPATRLQNGLPGTKGRPASSRAHHPIFIPPRVDRRTMTTSGMNVYRRECLRSFRLVVAVVGRLGSLRSFVRLAVWRGQVSDGRAGLPATTA